MIDPTKVRLLANYVLIKPDDKFETYQFGGRETSILTASSKLDSSGVRVSTEQEHVAISGIVYGVPEKLVYNAKAIWHLQDNNDYRKGTFVRTKWVQQDIDRLRNDSVQFDVPMELKVGDRVYFEYMAHMFADQQGLWVDTTEGKMMLIKYDLLIMTDEIMLNGFLLIENEKIEKSKIKIDFEGNVNANADSWEIEGEVLQSGIVLVGTREEKKYRSYAYATLHKSAHPCKSYLDFRGKDDCGIFMLKNGEFYNADRDLQTSDRLLYDPRFAKEIEFGLHRVMSEKKLLRIQRKDVHAIVTDN